MQVTTTEYRKALGQFATGVTAVTVMREDQSVHGMTANSFMSVSPEPLEILVYVDRRALTYRYSSERGNFAVNVISENQDALARFFPYSEQHPEMARSLGVEFHATGRGTPLRAGSLVQLDRKLASSVDAGDHTTFIGAVVEMNVNDGKPLLFGASQHNHLNAGG
jgi:flavin reductase (DIM6/NTAB) family NADH-FMN oxidoreductase RutF